MYPEVLRSTQERWCFHSFPSILIPSNVLSHGDCKKLLFPWCDHVGDNLVISVIYSIYIYIVLMHSTGCRQAWRAYFCVWHWLTLWVWRSKNKILTVNTIMLEPYKTFLLESFWCATQVVGHIFARISGCSLWNVIRKQSSSPLAHRKQNHDTTISALSWLYHFYVLAFVGKGSVHISACGILGLMPKHSRCWAETKPWGNRTNLFLVAVYHLDAQHMLSTNVTCICLLCNIIDMMHNK